MVFARHFWTNATAKTRRPEIGRQVQQFLASKARSEATYGSSKDSVGSPGIGQGASGQASGTIARTWVGFWHGHLHSPTPHGVILRGVPWSCRIFSQQVPSEIGQKLARAANVRGTTVAGHSPGSVQLTVLFSSNYQRLYHCSNIIGSSDIPTRCLMSTSNAPAHVAAHHAPLHCSTIVPCIEADFEFAPPQLGTVPGATQIASCIKTIDSASNG